MRISDVTAILEQIAPERTAEAWDNVGLQLGDPDGEANGCLLTLDVTPDTIPEARRCKAALIISHHPLIFQPLEAIRADAKVGETLLAAARAHVALYAAHTNLDNCLEHGTAAALAERLGLAPGPALSTNGPVHLHR